MPTRSLRAAFAAIALVLGVAACGDDSTGPVTVPEGQLFILEQATIAPTLAQTSISFWAKRGTGHEVKLYYRPLLGLTDSTEFLKFKLDGESLLARPDGSAIAVGDSVLVTITVPDPTRFYARFEPSGLRFDPAHPAELRWETVHATDDLDDDGDVDGADLSLFPQLQIWRQATTGAPFTALETQFEVEGNEIELEADLVSFSNYVVAYRSSRPTE